ncbi:hypothetical protein BDP81DRAFT_422987 [Colletotrichum phormii]|uniref:Uncharacterized protein n=1 Tax=Colletotrichum phormii TaxID=359342 RepID=A0AAI9ZW26_9PEZI|nr:uncharacterized protein BDP81DRAFT_422987 [Colletotrichum phormii]KAK1638931.1 hypothetical protein BDP81DRAFT_422987 [Colletotrichum phormii]
MHHAAPTRPLVLLVSALSTARAGHLGTCNLTFEHTLKRVNLEKGASLPDDNATLSFGLPALNRPHTTFCSVRYDSRATRIWSHHLSWFPTPSDDTVKNRAADLRPEYGLFWSGQRE